jgi:hypothetical protein
LAKTHSQKLLLPIAAVGVLLAGLGIGFVACAEQLGIPYRVQDITGALEALDAYAVRDRAIAELIPGFGPGWKQRLAIVGGLSGRFNHFELIAADPSGTSHEVRLKLTHISRSSLRPITSSVTEKPSSTFTRTA